MTTCTHEVVRRERVDYVTYEDGEWKLLNWNTRLEYECHKCGVPINWEGKAIEEKSE